MVEKGVVSTAEAIAASAIYSVIIERFRSCPPSFCDILTIFHDILVSSEKLLEFPAINETLLLLTTTLDHTHLMRNRSLPIVTSLHTSIPETSIPSAPENKDEVGSQGELKPTEEAVAGKKKHLRSGKSSHKTNSLKKRQCDGLDTPASIYMALECFHDEGYIPDCSMRESLQKLVPKKMEENHLSKLLEDFTEFTMQTSLGEGRLTEDECLALFAYTYEIKVPAQELLPQLSGDDLKATVNALLQKKLEDPLSEGALEGHTGEGVLAHITGRQCLEKVSDEDAEKLSGLCDWISLPENYVSYPYQLYKDMNQAMRSFSAANPRCLDIYLPIIFHTKAALRKLPKSVDSSLGRPSTIVYRGIDIPIKDGVYSPGSTICWPAFSSTSLSNEIAKSFLAGHAAGTLFIIETTNARDISDLSHFPEEEEHLLPPQSLFRVKGMAGPGIRQILGLPDSVQIVELHELDEAESKVEFMVAEASYEYQNYRKEKSLYLYNEAYRKYPHTSMGLFCHGMALAWDKQGLLCPAGMELSTYHTWRLTESLEYFMKALKREPNHPMILTHYAYVLRMRGDIASARYHFWLALEVDPSIGDAIHGLAEIYLLNNNFHELETMGRKNTETHLTFSRIMWARGYHHDAKNAAFKAYLADPCNVDTYKWLKKILTKLDMQTEMALLEQAHQEHAQDPLGPDAFFDFLASQFDVECNPFCLGRQKLRETLQVTRN